MKLFSKKKKVETQEQKESFQRKSILKELDRQRIAIYSLFDEYATEAQKLNNIFCEMPKARERAEFLDNQESVNIGWNINKYEKYLEEKNNLVREKFNAEANLLTYKIELKGEDRESSDTIEKAPVMSVFPFPTFSTTPVIFDAEKNNIDDVLDSMISTFFVIEEEKEFMQIIKDFDEIGGFIGTDEEIGDYFKFLRNDVLMLAVNPVYSYNSYKSDTGVNFELNEIDDILMGINYTQKSIIFVLEELKKAVLQCQEFENYIEELNNTSVDDFEMYLEQ